MKGKENTMRNASETMPKKTRNYKGTISLGNTCDLTDPCYKKDVWCRDTTDVLPGEYNCYAMERYVDDWGRRVTRTWIIHTDYDDNGKRPEKTKGLLLGEEYLCGVDSGLFGYFDNKPDFSDEEWYDFCSCLGKRRPRILVAKGAFGGRDGFVTSSGLGDFTYYPECWLNDNGDVVAVSTQFI